MNARTLMTIAITAIIALAIGYVVFPRMAHAPSADDRQDISAGEAVTPISIISIKEDSSSTPMISVEYPRFPSLPDDLNTAIASATLSRLADFQQTVSETQAARAATGDPAAALQADAFTFSAAWDPVQTNGRYISFIERYASYAGGANGNEELQTFNYDVVGHRMMSLADLFPGKPDYLKEISAIARAQLTSSMSEASDGNVLTSMLNSGTEPTAESFENFTFTDYAVTIYFPKYAVAPGAFGEQHVTISYDEVK